MSTKSRLNKLYRTCSRVRLPEDVKILFISDTHLNDGSESDDFIKNETIFYETLSKYAKDKFRLVLLGDILDLWECPDRLHIYNINKLSLGAIDEFYENYQIKGNHDNSLDYPEAVVLQIGDLEIFCCHGHQGDLFNDRLWWIGQNVVRYLWVPLQWIGLHNAQRAKQKRHEEQEKRLCEWADDQKFVSMFGHTHLLANSENFKDAGCWVNQGGEGIIYENGKFEGRSFI